MEKRSIIPMSEKYWQYLSDESKMLGEAESISFPESEEEVLKIVAKMRKDNIPITVQGGKTGIAGCAVPLRGHILNLSNMTQVKAFIKTDTGDRLLKVSPGITLLELKKTINKLKDKEELFWPPDPTEASATVGGIVSCDAKGICSYLYGDTRNYIEQLRVVQSDGTILEVSHEEMDKYIGGEGMLGILTEITLRLQPKPKEIWGISFFFENKHDVLCFAQELSKKEQNITGACVAAIEYMDRATIDIIQERKEMMTKLQELPDVDTEICAMVYIEIHGNEEESVEQIAEILMELAEMHNSNADKAWAVSGDIEIEKMRAFRHAAAESTNLLIEKTRQEEPSITKLSTDMCIESESFKTIVTKYEEDLKKEGLKACIFGHIYGNHLHVNILPQNDKEYKKGHALIEKWAKETALKKGKIVTEHGVGKLKKNIFLKTASREIINKILVLKNRYDPTRMWNPDNMIEE